MGLPLYSRKTTNLGGMYETHNSIKSEVSIFETKRLR